MIKNPYINALVAGGYIAGIVLFMVRVIKTIDGTKDTILIPMTMLSLLVFSVALMGGLFFYEPAVLLMDNKRKEALAFFTKTLATFFCVVALFFTLIVATSLMQ